MSRTRTLVLMRHGKSGYPPATPDHDRPLAERGDRQAALAGRWMAEEGLRIDAVLCSTSTRTRQTLARTGIDAPVTFVEDIYGGAPEEILEALRVHAPADATVADIRAGFAQPEQVSFAGRRELAIAQARSRRASTIGISKASGGTGKTELSMKEMNPMAHMAWR